MSLRQRIVTLGLSGVVLIGGAGWRSAGAESPDLPATATTTGSAPAYETVQGFFREYALGDLRSGPAIVAIDETDTVWTALAKSGQLARFRNGSIEVFDIGPDSRPVGLAAGSRKNGHPGVLWIAASFDNKILRFDTATEAVREYPIDGDEAWPFNIAIAPDGMLWFTQRASGRLGRLDPATGEIRHFEPPTPGAGPAGMAIDPRDGTVWFGEGYADRIGRLDPATGEIEEIALGESSNGNQNGPAGLAIDPDGGVWFAKLEGKLGHIPPGSRQVELLDVPPAARRPAGVAVAANGDVWTPALDGNLLLRYRPSTRTFTAFPLPSGQPDQETAYPPIARTSRPFGIGIDAQGNVWFSEQYRGQLGVLDTTPPRVKLVSPSETVQSLGIPVTYTVEDRVSGVAEVHVLLGGQEVALRQGALDLSRATPGAQELELVAVDHAGNQTTTRTRFEFAPGPLALTQLLRRLEPQDEAGRGFQEGWIEAVKTLRPGSDASAFEALRASLEEGREHFTRFPGPVLAAILDYQQHGGGGTVEVDLLDKPPYFEPLEIVVAPGDTIQWHYEAQIEGHKLSTALHRIVIEGS
ncbi:MAG: SMP-30/gluconolactonase/LRE family protein, partial [Acidobacteria bacterium]|nr:SMP-30/gluconolactonase/LRE family protein [Acidobacteriota bacterium]